MPRKLAKSFHSEPENFKGKKSLVNKKIPSSCSSRHVESYFYKSGEFFYQKLQFFAQKTRRDISNNFKKNVFPKKYPADT